MSISFTVLKKRREGGASVQGRPKKPSLNRVKNLFYFPSLNRFLYFGVLKVKSRVFTVPDKFVISR